MSKIKRWRRNGNAGSIRKKKKHTEKQQQQQIKIKDSELNKYLWLARVKRIDCDSKFQLKQQNELFFFCILQLFCALPWPIMTKKNFETNWQRETITTTTAKMHRNHHTSSEITRLLMSILICSLNFTQTDKWKNEVRNNQLRNI